MARASDFMKMAILMDDDLGLLLAAEKLKSKSSGSAPKFVFESYSEERSKVDFRFHKCDISRLQRVFRIPVWMKTKNGLLFKGIEGKKMVYQRW